MLLPEGARTYHKTGTLPGIAHDGGIIRAPDGAFVLVCLSSGVDSTAVASQAIAQMSRAAWGAFRSVRRADAEAAGSTGG